MTNRLADAPSPYLQQHEDNPVDWWPWCDEAIAEAKARGVPIFLSIGYATCHWCHVMAHESFEDEAVAALMNEAFVCIKVDREERPDLDAMYMNACQAMTGRGGWPMTMVLDHALRPWFAGTYFPKASRPGMIGMTDLVPRLSAAWQDQRSEVDRVAGDLVERLTVPPLEAGDLPGPEAIAAATDKVLANEDPHGGFRSRPKFPSLQTVRFLLRRAASGHEGALDAACRQLDAMANGGIRDHVGGGFHRYSTDEHWFLPHFEKMLYDQGMALLAYAEAHMMRPTPLYEEVLRDTAEYLLRDMQDAGGAFYAAEDADSEGEEGRFYTWPWEELLDILDGDEALASALGARPEGNHLDESTREPVPRNHLYAADPAALAGPMKDAWQQARPRLLARRAERIRPLRDEKIMADWNGLAVAGLAAAGRALRDQTLVDAAAEAFRGTAEALQATSSLGWTPEDLRHTRIGDHIGDHVFLEDWAGMAFAASHLAAASHRASWASLAGKFQSLADRHWVEGAGYTRTRQQAGPLPDAPEPHDGAMSSGHALLAEAALSADRLLFALGASVPEKVLRVCAGQIKAHPTAFTGLLAVADDLLAPHVEVIIVANDASRFTDVVPAHPRVYALAKDGPDDYISAYRPAFDEGTGDRAYVCRGDACEAAVTTPEELAAAIERSLRGSSGAAADAR